jgi:hypothetical protein
MDVSLLTFVVARTTVLTDKAPLQREPRTHLSTYVLLITQITSEKKKAMKTFVQTKDIFLEAFAQLKRLEGSEKVTQALRIVKERETGKLCYQAEEDLSQAEISVLKGMLNAKISLWEVCKQQCRESVPTWGN